MIQQNLQKLKVVSLLAICINNNQVLS